MEQFKNYTFQNVSACLLCGGWWWATGTWADNRIQRRNFHPESKSAYIRCGHSRTVYIGRRWTAFFKKRCAQTDDTRRVMLDFNWKTVSVFFTACQQQKCRSIILIYMAKGAGGLARGRPRRDDICVCSLAHTTPHFAADINVYCMSLKQIDNCNKCGK